MKKVVSLVCALCLVCALAIPAFAASNNDVINEIKAGVNVNGTVKQIPADYVKAASDFLEANDLTEDQLTTILNDVKEAKAVWAATGETEFKNIPADVQAKLINMASASAKKVGATLTFDGKTVKVVDKNGKVYSVVKAGDPIKQTGAGANVAGVAVASVLLVSALGAAVVISKKHSEVR